MVDKIALSALVICILVAFYYDIKAYRNRSDFAKQYPLTTWYLGPFLGRKYYTEKGLKYRNLFWLILAIGMIIDFIDVLSHNLPKEGSLTSGSS